MKVFVSGSKTISSFDSEIIKVLNRMVENNHEILVGDCEGVDVSIQLYMKEKAHNNTTVYNEWLPYANKQLKKLSKIAA